MGFPGDIPEDRYESYQCERCGGNIIKSPQGNRWMCDTCNFVVDIGGSPPAPREEDYPQYLRRYVKGIRAQLAAERGRADASDGYRTMWLDAKSRAAKAEAEAKRLPDKAIEYALGKGWLSDSNDGEAIAFRAALREEGE